jgi:hypothetical protein
MKKSVFFRLIEEEFKKLEAYCESTGRYFIRYLKGIHYNWSLD